MTTKIPGIPTLPGNLTPELRAYLMAMQENVEVRTGVRGDPKDRAVTLRELLDSGLAEDLKANKFDPNHISSRNRGFGAPGSGVDANDLAVPPAPTGFSAAGGFTKVVLEWDDPNVAYGNHAFTEIFRLSTDTIGDAVLVGVSTSFVYTDEVSTGSTNYYWVRHVSKTAVVGPYNSGAGTSATTSEIASADIADDAVTNAKLAIDAVQGDVIAAGAIDGDKIASDAVTAVKIATDAVTNAKLATNAVQGDVIAASAITATKIEDGAVETAKIAANAVTASEIAANTVTAAEIASNTVTASEIAADTITSAEIAANTITSAEIAANTITAGEIAANAVTASEIAANTITASEIAASTITSSEMVAGTITAASGIIADAAITNAKIAAATIESAKISDSAITNAKIANAAITNAKIQDATIQGGKIAANTINGNRVTADTLVLYDKADFGTMGSIQLHAINTADPAQQSIAYTSFVAASPRQTHSSGGKVPTITGMPTVFSRTYSFNMRSASQRAFLFDIMVEPYGSYSSSSHMGYVITLDTNSSNTSPGNIFNAYLSGPFTGSQAGSRPRIRRIVNLTSGTNYYLKVFFYSKSISDNGEGDRGVVCNVSVEGLFV